MHLYQTLKSISHFNPLAIQTISGTAKELVELVGSLRIGFMREAVFWATFVTPVCSLHDLKILFFGRLADEAIASQRLLCS